MGCLSIILSLIATFILFKIGHIVLMYIAITIAIGCYWSWGIMHNFATEMAKKRPDYSGSFFDITKSEARSVPNWITIVNIVFTLSSLAVFIGAITLVIVNR